MRDFVIRSLMAQDEPWWSKTPSVWKITAYHTNLKEDDWSPDYWSDRALNLCTFDVLQTNFGMSYQDLMDLDVPSFERLESRVHQLAKRQHDLLPADMKEAASNGGTMNPFPKVKGFK